MIESNVFPSAVTGFASGPAEAAGAGAVAPSSARSGWASLGLGGADASHQALPSVGAGQDLSWARSWAQLSHQLQSVGSTQSLDRIFNQPVDPLDGRALMGQYREVIVLSKQMHEATVQLQMLVQLLQTTSGAADRLLKQQ